jgi:hypothetical protein
VGVRVVVFRVEVLPRDLHATDVQMDGGSVGWEEGGSRAGSGICGRVGGCLPCRSSPRGPSRHGWPSGRCVELSVVFDFDVQLDGAGVRFRCFRAAGGGAPACLSRGVL